MKKHSLRVFSRHPSHDVLREPRILTKVLACIRLGSTTSGKLKYAVEINSPGAIQVSANKLLMKQAFAKAGVTTAEWFTYDGKQFHVRDTKDVVKEIPFPIVAKHVHGSRGRGNTLLKTAEELNAWLPNKDIKSYIFERFYSYSREYRLHMTADGCFYTCRKMLKSDTPQEQRWFRNDSNSVWIVEENPDFDKPVNWNEIVADCVKGLNAVGLDVGAFDVRVQSALDSKDKPRKRCEWIVLESNSAPSFGDITAKKYQEVIHKIIDSKI